MKFVIFAGGVGTRLWPLSRQKSPKQFEEIIGDKSTLQAAYDRLSPEFDNQDIFVSTHKRYVDIVKKQLPNLPEANIISEPEKKDVGPAIALVMGIMSKMNKNEPVAILWSDHLVKRVEKFRKILNVGGKYIKKNPNKIVFIGHNPRYPSVNLGYIHFGKKKADLDTIDLFQFEGFKYKPDKKTAKRYMNSGRYAWNLGYFITSPSFLYNAYKRLAPIIYKNTERIVKRWGKSDFKKILKKEYGKVESISFDNAILENLDKDDALVIIEDIGWSDIGAWEALKEALEKHPGENVTKGNLYLEDVSDSLIYNYEDRKLIVGIDLDESLIVNTKDALLIAKKGSVPKIKKIVNKFADGKNEDVT